MEGKEKRKPYEQTQSEKAGELNLKLQGVPGFRVLLEWLLERGEL